MGATQRSADGITHSCASRPRRPSTNALPLPLSASESITLAFQYGAGTIFFCSQLQVKQSRFEIDMRQDQASCQRARTYRLRYVLAIAALARGYRLVNVSEGNGGCLLCFRTGVDEHFSMLIRSRGDRSGCGVPAEHHPSLQEFPLRGIVSSCAPSRNILAEIFGKPALVPVPRVTPLITMVKEIEAHVRGEDVESDGTIRCWRCKSYLLPRRLYAHLINSCPNRDSSKADQPREKRPTAEVRSPRGRRSCVEPRQAKCRDCGKVGLRSRRILDRNFVPRCTKCGGVIDFPHLP